MPEFVTRDRVIELLDDGAQLVDVLPADDYEHMHLPGAVSLPLKESSAERAREELDRDRPVVTYCNGFT